ncbi:hypothetical protein J8TS2_02440 [Lederbergia ruris]|uniref:Uncharacterized protein n=1 Tax=Lederbergia ruris TaxID=217495 RepID=A0ABQ4KD75_9BACI|nr:hypothetical protein J8TS2_02440 [Lederbergia ruris]
MIRRLFRKKWGIPYTSNFQSGNNLAIIRPFVPVNILIERHRVVKDEANAVLSPFPLGLKVEAPVARTGASFLI